MTLIAFDCDRCKKPVSGLHVQGFTGGFYVVDREGGATRFGRADEHFVCDDCVHSMPEYQAIYGERA